MSNIRRLTKGDMPRLRDFWIEYWGGGEMLMHSEIIQYSQVEGFIYGDWIGLLTYIIRGKECEVTSLNSLQEGVGIGKALIDEIINEAKEKKCRRVFLITTNDNLHALGFYQRYGFELVAIYRGAINESRKIKPSIPLVGMNNIPLRDEIELEIVLSF